MRTPIEALKEIRDRLTYFCLRTDGKYDPPWATELVGIIDDAVTDSHAIGNAAARDEVVLRLSKDEYKGMQEALSEHDRLCEMLSESRKSVGNAAAMREALKCAKKKAQYIGDILELLAHLNYALSAPPRNCDVGTAEEQTERFEDFCEQEKSGCCGGCAFNKLSLSSCFAEWAQMPYEAEEGGAK